MDSIIVNAALLHGEETPHPTTNREEPELACFFSNSAFNQNTDVFLNTQA